MQSKKRNNTRLILDGCMLVLLLCLMAYQVTGEMLHEWIGIAMTLTVIAHQILNRRWYGALFKGKYNAYRSLTTLVNILLLAAMAATAFCGVTMSGYAVPFLYWQGGVFLVRQGHLAMSHWAFVLMGVHLGLHLPLMGAKWKLGQRAKTLLALAGTLLGGAGFWLFVQNGMPDYLFFRAAFAFLDYEKPGWQVFCENAMMLGAFAFLGAQLASLCLQKKGQRKRSVWILGSIAAALLIGLALHSLLSKEETDAAPTGSGWAAQQVQTTPAPTPAPQQTADVSPVPEDTVYPQVADGFVSIPAGSFLMGSPESENWRIGDEGQPRGRRERVACEKRDRIRAINTESRCVLQRLSDCRQTCAAMVRLAWGDCEVGMVVLPSRPSTN